LFFISAHYISAAQLQSALKYLCGFGTTAISEMDGLGSWSGLEDEGESECSEKKSCPTIIPWLFTPVCAG